MPTVLIVDDEESIRSMLQLFLENEGFSVTTVGTVAEALALIPQYHFDVLISDAQRRTSRRWLRSSERNAANPT